jgi:hypothetical protein
MDTPSSASFEMSGSRYKSLWTTKFRKTNKPVFATGSVRAAGFDGAVYSLSLGYCTPL